MVRPVSTVLRSFSISARQPRPFLRIEPTGLCRPVGQIKPGHDPKDYRRGRLAQKQPSPPGDTEDAIEL